MGRGVRALPSSKINDFKVAANFNLREFVSPDTGTVKIVPLLVERLQAFRDKVGKPVLVTSGYRTLEHNAAIGGFPNSYHTQGLAADIVVAGMSSAAMAEVAKAVGFTGVGVYPKKGHCHVDVRPGPQAFFNGEQKGE